MANIQWKSWIETYNDPELNINLLKGGKLIRGDVYSFYGLTTTEGPTDPNKRFQKIIGTFENLNPDKEGEAIFVDCVDENKKPIGERTGFVRFKFERSSDSPRTKLLPDHDYDSITRPYYAGTRKRRRFSKNNSILHRRRRKTNRNKKRNLNRRRKTQR